jgi:hypothetical protein
LQSFTDARVAIDTSSASEIQDYTSLINSALASSTWAKYRSGYNAYVCFEAQRKRCAPWPLPIESVRAFVVWCHSKRKLAPSTIKTYLCAIKFVHHLRGLKCTELEKDPMVSLLMRGATHIYSGNPSNCSTRRVVTFPLLLILGHKIAETDWDKLTKQTYWSLCTTAFFGSFRLGELLAPRETTFSPVSNLTWQDIRHSTPTTILIHIKQPKSGEKEGEYIDLFPFENYNCCPVLALDSLREKQIQFGIFNESYPPFRLPDGKNVTKAMFNRVLASLLPDLCEPGKNTITGHSFRSGIPSTISLFPNLSSNDSIKGWGRWASDCFTRYTRLKLPQKAAIFTEISTALQSVSATPSSL